MEKYQRPERQWRNSKMVRNKRLLFHCRSGCGAEWTAPTALCFFSLRVALQCRTHMQDWDKVCSEARLFTTSNSPYRQQFPKRWFPWNVGWILLVLGSLSLRATGLIISDIGKGPTKQGVNLRDSTCRGRYVWISWRQTYSGFRNWDTNWAPRYDTTSLGEPWGQNTFDRIISAFPWRRVSYAWEWTSVQGGRPVMCMSDQKGIGVKSCCVHTPDRQQYILPPLSP